MGILAADVTDVVTRFKMNPYKGFLITPKTGDNVLHAISYNGNEVTKLAAGQIFETYGFKPPFKDKTKPNGWNLGDGVNRGEVLHSYKRLPPDFLTVPNPYSLREYNVDTGSAILDTDLIYSENQSFIIAINSSYKNFVNLLFKKDSVTKLDKPEIKYTTKKKWEKQKPQAGNIWWSNGDKDREKSFQYYSRLGKYVNLGTIYTDRTLPVNDTGDIDYSHYSFEVDQNVKAVVASYDPPTDFQQNGLYEMRRFGEWKPTDITKNGLLWGTIEESICGLGVVKDNNDEEWLLVMTRPVVTEVKFYAKKLHGHSKETDIFDNSVFMTLIQQYGSSQNPDTKKIIADKIRKESGKWREVATLDFKSLIPLDSFLYSQSSFPEFSFSQDGTKAVGIVSHIKKVVLEHRHSLTDGFIPTIEIPNTDENANLSSVIELTFSITSQEIEIENDWSEYNVSLTITPTINKPCLISREIIDLNNSLNTERKMSCILAVDYKDNEYREIIGSFDYKRDSTINASGSSPINMVTEDIYTNNYRILLPDGNELKYDELETVNGTKKQYSSPLIWNPFTEDKVGNRKYEMLESVDLRTDSYIVRTIEEIWESHSNRDDFQVDTNGHYLYSGGSSYDIQWKNSVKVYCNSQIVYSSAISNESYQEQHSFTNVSEDEGVLPHYFFKPYFIQKERYFPFKEVRLQNPFSDPVTLQLIPAVDTMVGFFANDDIAGNNGRDQQGVAMLPSGNFVMSVYEGNYFAGQIKRDKLKKEDNPNTLFHIYLKDDIKWVHMAGNVNNGTIEDIEDDEFLGLVPNPKATIFPISYIGE